MKSTSLSRNTAPLHYDVPPANPLRGAGYRDAAISFLQQFPIGSTLTWEQFAQFALEHGLLAIETLPTEEDEQDKQSNGWLAYLQRRHQARAKLNKASSHPELNPYGGAFTIEPSGGALVVRSTSAAIAETDAPQRIMSLATTKRRKIEYLLQSTDWSALPPHERGLAETVLEDINNWVERVHLESNQLETKFQRLGHKLRLLVDSNQIEPSNGGISKLLSNDED